MHGLIEAGAQGAPEGNDGDDGRYQQQSQPQQQQAPLQGGTAGAHGQGQAAGPCRGSGAHTMAIRERRYWKAAARSKLQRRAAEVSAFRVRLSSSLLTSR